MTSPVDDPNAQRWIALSALCDGEATAAEARGSFERWADDPGLRARWHNYQWIGDAMRSDDLATDAGHDQAFLLALRARLQAEPVVLAPQRTAAAPAERPAARGSAAAAGGVPEARRQRWAAPAAMAAGVMAVAGALVVIRGTTALTEAELVGPVADGNQALIHVAAEGGEAPVPTGAASASGLGDMVRNPELDRYLAAHRQFAQTPALTTPGGVRQVAATPGR